MKAAEAEEAKRAALDSETAARRAKAVTGLQGKIKWSEGVEAALKKVAERSDDGWIVTLVRFALVIRLGVLIRSRRSPPTTQVE